MAASTLVRGGVFTAADVGAAPTATQSTTTDQVGGASGTIFIAIADPADTPADADTLRDDLVNNALVSIRTNFTRTSERLAQIKTDIAALKTWANTLRTNAQAAEQME